MALWLPVPINVTRYFMPLQTMRSGGYYVLTVSRCSDVPCRHGLVRRAGESTTYMGRRRHHMTATSGLSLSSFLVKSNDTSVFCASF